jgi:hypothetical protein
VTCPTATFLFEKWAEATSEYVKATDKLSALVGQHVEFTEAKKRAEEMEAKCRAARQALEQHGEEHGCRTKEG